jgi:hypothetical protein
VLVTLPIAARETEEFSWNGPVRAGGSVEIKNVNGAIEVEQAGGGDLEIEATKTGRRDDPSTVTIEVVEHAGGVTVCAVYPGSRNRCEPGEGGNLKTKDNDVSVSFRVRVPAGVPVFAKTVNGAVEVDRLDSDVTAQTVNGSIDVDTDGVVSARTVNGSIDVRIGSIAWDGNLEFETVNGSIEIEAPAGLSTRVDLRTQNGRIETDWPLTIEGRFIGRHVEGTIGSGAEGRRLVAKTVNGNIELER